MYILSITFHGVWWCFIMPGSPMPVCCLTVSMSVWSGNMAAPTFPRATNDCCVWSMISTFHRSVPVFLLACVWLVVILDRKCHQNAEHRRHLRRLFFPPFTWLKRQRWGAHSFRVCIPERPKNAIINLCLVKPSSARCHTFLLTVPTFPFQVKQL